jgi:tetratricopeptide (TPR) repeat protein
MEGVLKYCSRTARDYNFVSIANRILKMLLASLLVLTPGALPGQEPKTANKGRVTTPKTTATVTAGVPKEELDKEARFKDLIGEGIRLYDEGKYEEARPHFRSAAEFTEQLHDKDAKYHSLDDALRYLGQSFIMLKQYQDAEAIYSRRLAAQKEYLQFDSATAGSLQVLGELEALQNHWNHAEDYYKQSAAYLDECIQHFKHSDSYDPQDIVANNDRTQKSGLLMYLAAAYAREGKRQDAVATNEQAYSLGEKFHAQPALLLQIVQNSIAILRGTAQADELNTWLQREGHLKAKPQQTDDT